MSSFRTKTAAAILSIVTLAAASCSSSTPTELGDGTTSTSNVEPGDTPQGDSSTTTTTVTSSTEAPTAVAEARDNPIEFAFAGGWLLGGWDGNKWVDAVGPYDDPPEIPSPVHLVPLDSDPTSTENVALSGTCDWLAEDENSIPYSVEFDGQFAEFDSPVGSTADWALQPHPIERIEDTSPYIEQVNNFLKTLDVTDQSANIINVWRADFRGDGAIEVIIEARKTEGDNLINQAPGNYSVVLIVSAESDHLPVGLYVDGIPTNTEPVSTEESDYGHQIYASKPIGFADLNGDGKMEIVLADWGWESSGVRVFEYIDGTYQVVLDKGCGV